MPASEAPRNDLYNGLTELLGPERAETLMTHLQKFDPGEVATKSDVGDVRSELKDVRSELKADISDVRSELKDLRSELKAEISDLRSELKGEIGELRSELADFRKDINSRFDRMHNTLVVGLFVIVAAMAGVFFAAV